MYKPSAHFNIAWEYRRILTDYRNQPFVNERGDTLNLAFGHFYCAAGNRRTSGRVELHKRCVLREEMKIFTDVLTTPNWDGKGLLENQRCGPQYFTAAHVKDTRIVKFETWH